MRRFYVNQQSISENLATLSPDESRHIVTVLRLQAGAAIELFDGTGFVYQGIILSTSPGPITVELRSRTNEHHDDARRPLFLVQCLLKGKKMDFLVQKATELGVHSFRPVLSRYSENHGNLSRQTDRWQRIMLESCKQCKRACHMIIEPVTPFSDIDVSAFEQPLVLWEKEESTGLDAAMVSHEGPMALFIGPEGGFTDKEINTLLAMNFKPVSLGARILRAETAALSAIAILQFLSGSLSPVRT
jgi:16S rRNA (uracil1498-N3)-methyltransferase